MKNKLTIILFFLALSCGREKQHSSPVTMEKASDKVRLMILDPGHFHAALVQKTMYAQVDSTIYVYAPEGPEVNDFLEKINSYNSRAEAPTAWKVQTYLGPDYLDRMISEKPGDVMVVAGKNLKKIDYILAAVEAGIDVYADKPMVIDPDGFKKLTKAFAIAQEQGLLIYDIMTERFEITTMLQKELSMLPYVFGELADGTVEEPAISKESVHHFFKSVSGYPLVRPPWFFDIAQEGEGIVDVTTHLVDLVQWEAFPGQSIDSSNIEMINANRWPTLLSKSQFQSVTKLKDYPEYLMKEVADDRLKVFCNGEMNYIINGKHARVSVLWNFEAPNGTGDTHYSIMRGTKCNLIIKQGASEKYVPTLYVEATGRPGFEGTLKEAMENVLEKKYPGLAIEKISEGRWRMAIPEQYRIGHEAHFEQVTENFLKYLNKGQLPPWEVPNMLAKYFTIMQAYRMAQNH